MSEYPSDWEIANLGNLATIKASNVDKKAKEGQKQISLCNYMDVFRNPVVSSALAFMRSTASEKEISEFSLSKGDVLLTKDSEVPEEIGIPSVVAEDIPDLVCGYHLYMLRADRSRINPGYLCWALRSNSSRQYFYQMANGSTRFGLNLKHVEECPIAVPPLPEQKKIAEILSGIDKEIAGVSQIIQGKRLFRESLLRQIIPHQSSFSNGLPPEGWTLATIEEICSLITYGFTNPMPTTDRGIYMVTAKDVRDGKIDKGTARFTSVEAYETLLTDKSRPRRNDILVTKDGTLGRSAVVGEETICINQSVALLRPSDEKNAHFLQLLLSSPQYQETMLEESGGSAVKHIYITTLAKMPIAIPSSPGVREKVVGFCDALNKSIDILLKKHECLTNLKKGLASDLLSGRKRVSV